MTEPTRIVLAKGYFLPDDPDAVAYITAVEAADTAAGSSGGLEPATRMAINAFIKGCKADGIWPAIKASCILAGARTLAGALVPLLPTMPAPTNVGPFVSATDYNRKTGLVGNGSTKYLDSNRANSSDPQNNSHNACWVSTPVAGVLMASSSSLTGQNYMDIISSPATRFANRSVAYDRTVNGSTAAGLYGHSRSIGTQALFRCPQGSGFDNYVSQTTDTRNVYLYTRSNNGTTFSAYSSARLAFYSIGESLDLAKLDARVTNLINAINVAF